MDERVREILSQVPELRDREVALAALGGGLTNRNFRVQAGSEVYALRLFGTGTELLGIDRAQEVACCRAAAGAGIGPEVIAYLPSSGALLTRFLPGRVLTAEEVRRPAMLRRLAGTLRRLHALHAPAGIGLFSPLATVRAYHGHALDRGVHLPADFDLALRSLATIENLLGTGEPHCLCHDDLLAANLIDDGTTIYIIDWEYGGLGDPYFDLGNFAVNQQLNEEEERDFLTAYFGEASFEHFRRLRLMRLVSDMREAAWGFLQAGLSALHSPEYYHAYGCQHLERFLTRVAI